MNVLKNQVVKLSVEVNCIIMESNHSIIRQSNSN